MEVRDVSAELREIRSLVVQVHEGEFLVQLAILDVVVKMVIPVLVQAGGERLGPHIGRHVVCDQSCSLVAILIDHRAQSLVSAVRDIAHHCGLCCSVKNADNSVNFPRKQALRLEFLGT